MMRIEPRLSQRRPIILMFVDGLPLTDADTVVPADWLVSPMVPPLGYSVNIKAELFAGQNPDDLGWFCEWNIADEPRPRWQGRAARVASKFAGNDYIDYAAHRLLERTFHERLYNVPLECIHQLSKQGCAAYSDEFTG
jgi:hypothetical protein